MLPLPISPSVSRWGARRLTAKHGVPAGVVHVGQQLVSGDTGVVDQDVGVPGVMVAQMLGDLVDGIVGGDVEPQRGATDAAGGLGQGLGGGFHVDRDDAGPVAGEHLGDRRADAAGGAGHDGDLAVQRPVPVGRWRGVGRPDKENLAVDVRRLGRQDEPQGGFQARRGRFGVRRQVHQRHRGAAAQLLAQRAGEALQRALGDPLVGAGRRRRGWCRRPPRARSGRGCAAAGVKKSCRPFSPAGVVIPVASKTSPPNESAHRPPRLLPTTS